ncbi:MAG: UbiA-like polyprenyltransferase [Armatimonadota bacterium]|nr:putative 4-hydroxybenzoate polyprenyltransferase [bacterium]MDW8322199.1 UbiA-like polyprenyltransferase [Armatimonadota bacterium]
MLAKFWRKVLIILEMIKFEHTVFALPFALLSALLAARGIPEWRTLGWILVAMVGARSAAMAFNRIADLHYDALNPRTTNRALPRRLLTVGQTAAFTVVAAATFLLAAWQLNPLCFALSPVALLWILGYSYSKRFTALSHLWLGLSLGIAPVGAWLAVRGQFELVPILLSLAVMLWTAGFDIIYSLQDVQFDRQVGLRSLPQTIGETPALWLSRLMHVGMVLLLLVVGRIAYLRWGYYAGVGVVAALIAYEQSLVKPNDLSRVNLAFFTLNGWVSVLLFAFTVVDWWMFWR